MISVEFSPFVWANLALAGLLVFSIFTWLALSLGKSGANKAAAIADVSWTGHLSRFIVAFLGISALAGLMLLQTGWVFERFEATEALGRQFLDGQSFVGLIGVWVGAPVAFASALYAIYMAHAALELAKGQTRISESQLALDNSVNDPERPVFVDGINSLLDLDSAAMALMSLGHLQLRQSSGSASERDALRTQLASILTAINSQAMLRLVNRLPEREVILQGLVKLRFALFRANEVNHGMPLRTDSHWVARRGEWARQMAEALSAVRRESVRVVASVRRVCDRHPSLAPLPRLQVAASGANLAETAAVDQLVDTRAHSPSKCVPAFGIVELVDDGQSKDRLLTTLTRNLEEVPTLNDHGPPSEDNFGEWEDRIRNFDVGPKQYCIFEGFEEFWRVLFNDARRESGKPVRGLGEGLVIIIDTPYGAEQVNPEAKALKDEKWHRDSLNASAMTAASADYDYKESSEIWEIARNLAKLPAKAELMRRLLASSKSAAESAGAPTQVGPEDSIQCWDDVRQLIDLQNRLAKTPMEDLQWLANEHYDIEHLAFDKLIWINVNFETKRQLDKAGDWWYKKFRDARYFWLNKGEGELRCFERSDEA